MNDNDKKIEVAASELVRLIIRKLQDENTDVICRTSLFITYNLFSHESDFTVVYDTLGRSGMIGNYNNDYDYDDNEYLNDDTIEIPLSCEDDEYREDYLREQEQEQKSVLQKMIEYKNENAFLVIYTKCPVFLVLLLFYC